MGNQEAESARALLVAASRSFSSLGPNLSKCGCNVYVCVHTLLYIYMIIYIYIYMYIRIYIYIQIQHLTALRALPDNLLGQMLTSLLRLARILVAERAYS